MKPLTNSELREKLDDIRSKIIDAANNGDTEAINNDDDYYLTPLMELITAQQDAIVNEVIQRLRNNLAGASIRLDNRSTKRWVETGALSEILENELQNATEQRTTYNKLRGE